VSGIRRVIIGASSSPGGLQALRHTKGAARADDAASVPVLAWVPPSGDFAGRRGAVWLSSPCLGGGRLSAAPGQAPRGLGRDPGRPIGPQPWWIFHPAWPKGGRI